MLKFLIFNVVLGLADVFTDLLTERAKKLFDMNYGTSRFRTRNAAEVEKLLLDAGKGAQAESVFEAGPQSVTQVRIAEQDNLR